jgi:hypothetical protein
MYGVEATREFWSHKCPHRLHGWGGRIQKPETLPQGEASFNLEMLRQHKPDLTCRNDWTLAANRASLSTR